MQPLFHFNFGYQSLKIGMHRQLFAETRLYALAQSVNLWYISFDAHSVTKLIIIFEPQKLNEHGGK
jgi:hypothetical protein